MSGSENIFFRFIDVASQLNVYNVSLCNGLSRVSYARLFLPYIISNCKKIVYLDCDIEIKRDIADLYRTDFGVTGNFLVAAVEDSYLKAIRHMKTQRVKSCYIADRLSMSTEEKYFNSGVLVMNLEAWRRTYGLEEVLSHACSDDFLWGDQDVLNLLCRKRVFYLHPAWNFMRSMDTSVQLMIEQEQDYREASSSPFLVHFAGMQALKYQMNKKKQFRFPHSKASLYDILDRGYMRFPAVSSLKGMRKKILVRLVRMSFFPYALEFSKREERMYDILHDFLLQKIELASQIHRCKERICSLEKYVSKFACILLCMLLSVPAGSQEALKSKEEEYYSFLALSSAVSSPCLNYRTLSDSFWQLKEPGIWNGQKLERLQEVYSSGSGGGTLFTRGIRHGVSLRFYGPEWFSSYNSSAPYGQNDSLLWQGKGYNSSLTAGIRLEAFGLEITAKPVVSFCQNQPFDYTSPNRDYLYDQKEVGDLYEGKASLYGYYGRSYVDAPQRFGEDSFFSFSPGDSEIRYTWYNFTFGFGTQSPWLGPAKLNPLLHSNNAPPYPKCDIGLRKTHLYLPWTGNYGLYLGDVEFRSWWGRLDESDYFDNDDENDKTLLSGVSFAFSPSFLPGLTVGVNRTLQSPWKDFGSYALFEVFDFFNLTDGGFDGCNGHFSVSFDYVLPLAGLELYLEWGRDDFSPDVNFLMRYPFHSQAWTIGGRKSFHLPAGLEGELLIELSCLESSRDYEGLWGTSFYVHSGITQGYTNSGQWLGAGIGTGGNSQYAGVKVYFPRGSAGLFLQRRNPDLDYTWFTDLGLGRARYTANNVLWEKSIRATFGGGVTGSFFLTRAFRLDGRFDVVNEWNPLNDIESSPHTRLNLHAELTGKYSF